ncbi:MAG: TonB-dependent receptor [Sphingomonadaceae bacterium]|nr:TonB-dependent receptor [Sphingomonadaceae bacterium]
MLYHSYERSRAATPALSLFALAAALAATPAMAQEEKPVDDLHHRGVNAAGEIVVSAIGVTQLDVLAGTSVLEGAELQRSHEGQIGDMLTKVPGVSATSFSPGASRPVLRGFQGERVRVLVDGIGTTDVSNTSADHATTIDPLTAERIEVLRGPAVLLFGSQAIGGAVNVIDKRIPQRRMTEPFHLDMAGALDTAFDLREAGASLDLPVGQSFVVHASGGWRETDDMRVPGFVVAEGLRADLLADADEEEEEGELDEAEELREAANARGTLASSATRTWSANAGFAFFEGDSNLGASIGWYDTRYGVPLRPGAGHHHGEEEHEGEEHEDEEHSEEDGEESVSIALEQFRADLRGRLALGDGFFEALNTRVGYSDYTHTEFEGDEVGTVFDVKGMEARAVLEQANRDGWRGSIGLQYYYRDFDANGAEAYVPKNRTDQFAVFGLQEIPLGALQLELAGRYEGTKVKSQPIAASRSFDTFSGAVGLAHETEKGLRFGVTGHRAERAPSAEELYSNGPHIATQAFEVGNPGLTTERAWGVEAFVRGRIGLADVNIAVFRNWFDNFIYLDETGEEEDELPVFEYLQGDVDYMGVEGEISVPIVDSGPFRLIADLRGDYIKAELANGTPLPRIPPLRLLGAIEAQTERFDVRGEVEWFDDQNRVAAFETPTDGFTQVNASIAWKPLRGDRNVTVLLQGNNLFDTTGRRHASFTKDFVPLAGRNVRLSVRTSF